VTEPGTITIHASEVLRGQEDARERDLGRHVAQAGARSTSFRVTCLPSWTNADEEGSLELRIPAVRAYALHQDRTLNAIGAGTHALPFPVGRFIVVEGMDGQWWQVDFPPLPHTTVSLSQGQLRLRLLLRSTRNAGIILWGDHKISRDPRQVDIDVQCNAIDGLDDCVWIEPFPNAARAVLCITDHPDWDSIPKCAALAELFDRARIRHTKAVFPAADPVGSKNEPGLDSVQYRAIIDAVRSTGSEIAIHGFSPRRNAPPADECRRRLHAVRDLGITTWIDHGSGSYLITSEGLLDDGTRTEDLLTEHGIVNRWSYADIWENPRHADDWFTSVRRGRGALLDAFDLALRKRSFQFKRTAWIASIIPKNLAGPWQFRPLLRKPFSPEARSLARATMRVLRTMRSQPMMIYSGHGIPLPIASETVAYFDTVLLNHLGIQLRPDAIDWLCRRGGIFLAHTYMTETHAYGGDNCFRPGTAAALLPAFVSAVEHISTVQQNGELVTMPVRDVIAMLRDFTASRMTRTHDGWVASRDCIAASTSALRPLRAVEHPFVPGSPWVRLNAGEGLAIVQ
jgi:hypothetical protein